MKIYPSLHYRLTTQHLALPEIIKYTSTERKILNPVPGKWSIHDNITHLAKYQVTFIERINKLLLEDVPQFDRYSAEDDPEFEIFRNLTDDELVKYLNEQRIELTELILSLPENKLERIGVHKKFGRLSIVQWVEFFLLHEAHHLFTIFHLANDSDLDNSIDIF